MLVGRLFNYTSVAVASGALKSELQPELQETRIVYSRVGRAEADCVDIANRLTELRVVKQVEKFRPEIQAHILPRQPELLDHGEVRVDKVRTVDGYTAGVAKLTVCRLGKAGRVYVLYLGLVGVGVAASHLVWTVEVVAVAAGVKGHARDARPAKISVSAVNEGISETGGDLLNKRQLPAAQNRVGRFAPTVAKLLTRSEGQVVDHTASKVMMQVDLGGSPIELLPIRQREIGCTYL